LKGAAGAGDAKDREQVTGNWEETGFGIKESGQQVTGYRELPTDH
jgi:hypothetical protein